MSFFVSESLKGVLTEAELVEEIDDNFSKNISGFSVVIGNNSLNYYFDIIDYFVDESRIVLSLSENYLGALFFRDDLLLKSLQLGHKLKEINLKFKFSRIKRQKGEIDYEVEILF